jgi:ABC-type uncharacterized transport system ATPase component
MTTRINIYDTSLNCSKLLEQARLKQERRNARATGLASRSGFHRVFTAMIGRFRRLLQKVSPGRSKFSILWGIERGGDGGPVRALIMDPAVMLFDEPTSALDPRVTDEALTVIGDLAIRDRTSIIVTHEMGFARHVASEIVVMAEGRIVEQGPPNQIFRAPRSRATRQLLQYNRREALCERAPEGFGDRGITIASAGFSDIRFFACLSWVASLAGEAGCPCG